jgi:hypothetical protein
MPQRHPIPRIVTGSHPFSCQEKSCVERKGIRQAEDWGGFAPQGGHEAKFAQGLTCFAVTAALTLAASRHRPINRLSGQ